MIPMSFSTVLKVNLQLRFQLLDVEFAFFSLTAIQFRALSPSSDQNRGVSEQR